MVREVAQVLLNERIAEGIYSMLLRVSFAGEVNPGQFVMLYSDDRSRMLPRPLSICMTDAEKGTIRIVYRIAGAGTKEFSGWMPGAEKEVMGPIGNGFPVSAYMDKDVLLIGGGIGIPPLLGCAQALEHPAFAVGYRSETYLLDDIRALGETVYSTEDGSSGVCGNALDAASALGRTPDVIFACGPMAMLRAVSRYADERKIPCYLSLEEKMACGVGACLGCVVKTKERDSHSNVKNARICKDGPVFFAGDLDLQRKADLWDL